MDHLIVFLLHKNVLVWIDKTSNFTEQKYRREIAAHDKAKRCKVYFDFIRWMKKTASALNLKWYATENIYCWCVIMFYSSFCLRFILPFLIIALFNSWGNGLFLFASGTLIVCSLYVEWHANAREQRSTTTTYYKPHLLLRTECVQ